MPAHTIFTFNKTSNLEHWKVVDDAVMGGKSSGHFKLNQDGMGMFYGKVSLDNNGGFSSLRYRGDSIDTQGFQEIVLRIKGDGKRYQFRVKANLDDNHSYVSYFTTTGEWQTINMALKDLFPRFRGRNLSIPKFSGEAIEELGFLLANKKTENFTLLLESICFQ
ncbi:CIA30 family protein [Tamlana crocina]|uniref:CIA30 family protein n=1 Tax=Tamlana crocina TaxID=393006 RepID=A0ABX1DEF5_9FLAO|nr:CIA30 family protein [Tamlana crocina]NJX16736.1 CIA30 family protein [Tamlana crocina]